MSGNLSRRVERLEQESGAVGAFYHMIILPDGYDSKRALADVGLTPGQNDVVSFVELIDLGDGPDKDKRPRLVCSRRI